MSPPVILLHGAFCGGWSMENLAQAFAARGHKTHTPDLRHHEAGAQRARNLAEPGMTSMRDYASDISDLAAILDEPPILVGHSMGGLIAQMIAAQRPVRAMVLIAPSAPWGLIPSYWNDYASAFGLYMAAGNFWERAIHPAYEIAAEQALNRLNTEDRKAVFARFVPESGRAMFEILQWWLDYNRATKVAVESVSCPVLCIAGERDRVNPPESVKRVAALYKAQAEYREYKTMSHWLIGEDGWEQVAQDAVDWCARL